MFEITPCHEMSTHGQKVGRNSQNCKTFTGLPAILLMEQCGMHQWTRGQRPTCHEGTEGSAHKQSSGQDSIQCKHGRQLWLEAIVTMGLWPTSRKCWSRCVGRLSRNIPETFRNIPETFGKHSETGSHEVRILQRPNSFGKKKN